MEAGTMTTTSGGGPPMLLPWSPRPSLPKHTYFATIREAEPARARTDGAGRRFRKALRRENTLGYGRRARLNMHIEWPGSGDGDESPETSVGVPLARGLLSGAFGAARSSRPL